MSPLEVLDIDLKTRCEVKVKKEKNLSMQNKLLLSLLFFSVLFLALLWLFQIVFLEDFYKAIKTNELKSNANILIENIQDEGFSTMAEDISYRYGINIRITRNDETYSYLAHGGFKPLPAPSNNPANSPSNNMDDESLTTSESKPPFPDRRPMEILEYEHTIETEDETIHIYMQSVISPVDATVSTLQKQLLLVTGIMIIVSIFLSFFLSKNLSKPIIAISKKAKELGTGNYQIIFDEKGYKEIFELSETMNQTTKELEKVDSLRKELISNITHDLRTPLTLIEGYAEAMRDLPGENNEINAQIIIEEAKKLNELITDSIDMTSIETGVKEPHIEFYNITKSIADAIENIKNLQPHTMLTFQFLYDEEVYIYADKTMIFRAFNNILHNAINYGRDADTIIVSQKANDESVFIYVTDHGNGIEESEIPFIWDRYYRTNQDHQRVKSGTGLGLFITKEIITQHQGTYGVKSDKDNGTTFWFSLPLKKNLPKNMP